MANKRAYLRIFRDPDSSTGVSAAVLVKNVRPRRSKIGYFEIADATFKANFPINCEGYKIKPDVQLKICAQIPPYLIKEVIKKRKRERALACSPMLFE